MNKDVTIYKMKVIHEKQKDYLGKGNQLGFKIRVMGAECDQSTLYTSIKTSLWRLLLYTTKFELIMNKEK